MCYSFRIFFSHKSKIYYSIPDKQMTVILIYNRSKLMVNRLKIKLNGIFGSVSNVDRPYRIYIHIAM